MPKQHDSDVESEPVTSEPPDDLDLDAVDAEHVVGGKRRPTPELKLAQAQIENDKNR